MRGLYPLVLTAVVVVLFAPFWMQGRAFVPGDFLTTLYPWRADGVKAQNPEPFDNRKAHRPSARPAGLR